jgi:hypothetical protein
MTRPIRIALVSDVHFAGPTEQRRGNDYEYRDLPNPLHRLLCRYYRHYIWLRKPLAQNHLLDDFMEHAAEPDHVFALGDYTCDTAFVGVSDDGALESARICLDKLRARYGARLHALIGDHELGKFPLFGKRGGLRFASWRRVRAELGLDPFWQVDLGDYACVGITSTLIMLPAFSGEMLETERDAWESARNTHLQQIRDAFQKLTDRRRIILFCHDPSALPYLASEPAVQARVGQIAQTFVGHLHSPLILWKSRRLAGMPTIPFLGHTAKRITTALGRARQWKLFNVQLCPSLAGVELLKDGGFRTAELDTEATRPISILRHPLPR